MSSRLVHLLLVALLLLGQVSGWLHEMSHHAGPAGQTVTLAAGAADRDHPPVSPDDESDRQCLVCLTFAALALALPGIVLALTLLALRFALSAGVVRLAVAGRRLAHQARGPPVFS